MSILFTPWQYSGNFFSSSPFEQGLQHTASIIGSWYGDSGYGYGRPYQPGDANLKLPPAAAVQKQSDDYPVALEERAAKYVDAALARDASGNYLYHSASNVYSTTANNNIRNGNKEKNLPSEVASNRRGQEDRVVKFVDSLRARFEDPDKRADFAAGVEAMGGTPDGNGVLAGLANLLAPNATGEMTEEAKQAAGAFLTAEELPSDTSAKAFVGKLVDRLGGPTVVKAMLRRFWAHVQAKGFPTKEKTDYTKALEDKGFSPSEAKTVYNELFRGKSDSKKRKILGKMDKVKEADKIDEKERAKQHDIYARATAMRGMGVGDGDLEGYIKQYEKLGFAEFLDKVHGDVIDHRGPKVEEGADAKGGRGGKKGPRKRKNPLARLTPAEQDEFKRLAGPYQAKTISPTDKARFEWLLARAQGGQPGAAPAEAGAPVETPAATDAPAKPGGAPAAPKVDPPVTDKDRERADRLMNQSGGWMDDDVAFMKRMKRQGVVQ